MKQHAIADYSRVVFEQHSFVDRLRRGYANPLRTRGTHQPGPFLTDLVSHLPRAVPVFWSEEMIDVLFGLILALDDGQLDQDVLSQPDLLWPSAFVYFEHPLRMKFGTKPVVFDGLGWMSGAGTVGIVTNSQLDDETAFVTNLWPFGARYSDVPDGLGEEDRLVATGIRSFFLTMTRVMNQRLITVRNERPNRAARRMAESRIPFEPQIQVVTLRRPANPHPRDEHGIVDWKCRWIVRAHWRMQRVGPDRSEVKPVLVNAYVKGPEDRPLRAPRPTLVRVAA